ncbi:MAG: fasciclin domain-containing protein [Luteolibacter sp.]
MKTPSLKGIALALAIVASAPFAMAADETKVVEKTTTTTTEKKEVPAPGTVATVVRDGQNFSILNQAIKAAGLEETLGGKGHFTLFAPTDEAFTKLPEGSLAALLLPENKEKLRTLLTYHVIAGTQTSATFLDGKIKTLSGDPVKIDVDGNKDPIEVDDAKIVNPDQPATNGVVHVIDKVLVPETLDGFKGLKHND